MKILFIIGHGYMPQAVGGLQKCIDTFAQKLKNKGHDSAVLCSLLRAGPQSFPLKAQAKIRKAITGLNLSHDKIMGYSTWRTWFPWHNKDLPFPEKEIKHVINREKPDLVIISSGQMVQVAHIVQETGTPTIMWLVDVEFKDHFGDFSTLGNIPCVANSRSTADKHAKAFGVNPTVIHPFINLPSYRTETSREYVTLTNLLEYKGLNVALDLARACPDIPFAFVGAGHSDKDAEYAPLDEETAQTFKQKYDAPSNVTFFPVARDMRNIYARTRVLLAPSLWEEGYGRIVSEAQISAIPALTSNRGGLPEAVGPGGISLDPEAPITQWADALNKMWNDETYYEDLSAKALAHAQRPALDIDQQVTAWIEIIEQTVPAGKS